jgi:multidrug transporter EmrE-like cation transporter
MLNVTPLAYASVIALIDTGVFGALKNYTTGVWAKSWIIPLSMAIYSLQPFIFLKSLSYETMTVMNILWDIISDLFVTATGLLYFKEKLSTLKYIGLIFAFIGIVLLSYAELEEK